MSNNRLAPNAYNALYNRVPDPTARTPEYAPPLGIRQQLENVSAGLGRGAVTQLQDVQALVSDPRAYATNTLRGMRELMRNPALIGNVLRDTARRAKSGPLGLGEVVGEMLPLRLQKTNSARRDLDVYHGSPHKFEKFDSSKIGTGEGAQSYGYGMYFSESPDVANRYKIGLTNPAPQLTQELENVLPDVLKGKASDWADAIQSGKTISDLSASLRQPWEKAVLRQNKKAIESIIKRQQSGGSFYVVDLPDKEIAKMLDWDAPLSRQPPSVFTAMANMYELKESELKKLIELYPDKFDKTGAEIIKNFRSSTLYKEKGRLENTLRQAGIPGVKYFDALSRDKSAGTRNFVVFPGEENNLRILSRK